MKQNRILLVVALALLVLAIGVEGGSGLMIDAGPAADVDTPGMGIPYLALLDGLLCLTVLLKVLAIVLPARIHGAAQGCVTALVGLFALIGGVVMAFLAFQLLMLLLGLLLAVPFGTAVYMAVFGHFDRAGAAIALSLIMLLKLGAVGCLLLSHPDEMKSKATLLFCGCSLLANVVVSWLHGFLPRPLASITDTLAAIVVAILGIIWALLMLLGSISPIVKTLRVDRGLAGTGSSE